MKMKFSTIVVISIILLGCLLSSVQPVIAQTPRDTTPARRTPGDTTPTGTFRLTNPLNNIPSVGALLQKFIEIVSYLAILAAVLLIIWTGLQFILARGNPEKINDAKKRFLWIVIGVAIVIGARVIVTVVVNTLEATGTVNQGTLQSVRNAVP